MNAMQCREENFSRIQNFAASQKIRVINCQTFFYIFNFLSLTLDKTYVYNRAENLAVLFVFFIKRREKVNQPIPLFKEEESEQNFKAVCSKKRRQC